jgi:glutamate-ammonia-ligase adenylyltransferase
VSDAALESIPEPLRAEVTQVLDAIAHEPHLRAALARVCVCSQFVAESLRRDPGLLRWLEAQGRLDAPSDAAWLQQDLLGGFDAGADDTAFMEGLRRFRRRQLVRIAWRDLLALEAIEGILAELSLLADACIDAAVRRATATLAARHGAPRFEDGATMPMLVLGMGKLGGGELNFSSDIDLVFLYPAHGETDGPRPLSHHEYFVRLGQRIVQFLDNVTVDGFVYRVDMRLRPFGDSGALVASFDAFEDYLQQHGRDWERYAYVKARPVAGAEHFEALFRDVLRPFVYRRYLDFGVFESLREMKDLISREVERRELQGNVKLGPGGIREIEFIVQAFQLIRGGSDPRLQTRRLLEALPLLARQKLLSAEAVTELGEAYRFLRRVENRLQEWQDAQTHELPGDDAGRLRLAFAMDAPDWATLSAQIAQWRSRVSHYFQEVVFAPAQRGDESSADRALERILDPELDDAARRELLAALSLADPEALLIRINQLRDSGYYRRLDESGRRRLQSLMPRLLREVARQSSADMALARCFQVIERIGGRTVYLALLYENGAALHRFVDLCAHSKFLTDQIAAFPLLLDELIDARLLEALPGRAELAGDLRQRMSAVDSEDPELQVDVLRQFQRAAMFRVAVADLTGRLPLMKVSDRLTDIAELIVGEALRLAWQQITERHGVPQCGPDERSLRTAGVIVVAYGKFGGIELGYGSDLDLVFLHDSSGEVQRTAGPASVDNSVFFTRLVQRLVHLLTVHSAAGRLYEVDTRLRPSGKGGPLVQGIAGFDAYQRSDAWTWEHQALLRARAVAGPRDLCDAFERVRLDILRFAVRREKLRDDVRSMRERMRAELSRSKPGQFDLKQDAGGITDIEFLAQYWTLQLCRDYPELATYSDNIRQLESLASADLVPQATVDELTGAYRAYRQRMHHLSLEAGPTVVPAEEFAGLRATVTAIWRQAMEV